MRLKPIDFVIWAGASLSLLAVILLILHWFGYMPQGNRLMGREWQMEDGLKTVTLSCISAVHEIGRQPVSPERERQLKNAIAISAKLNDIDLKLMAGIRQGDPSGKILQSLRPDISAVAKMIEAQGSAFDNAKTAAHALQRMMEK